MTLTVAHRLSRSRLDSHGTRELRRTTHGVPPELRVVPPRAFPAKHGREEGGGVAPRVGDVPYEAHVCKLVGF